MGLGNRNAARAKGTLEDCKSKREGIGALECERQEAGVCNPGTRARSERDKRLYNFINNLGPEVLGKGGEE